jgi:hypothetical protein
MSAELMSRLRVGDEGFLVASLIERCPKTMMLRELVQNALEAAVLPDSTGARAGRVEIGERTIEGARKLTIWNTGPGMTADEMFRMCDIAASIGKTNALDQNFGMGAKVASLPSNQHGIRYRSCRGGRVHQVVMGKRDGLYGRIRQQAADGAMAEVIDVSDRAQDEGRDLSLDWTEVVLLGNHAGQDTVTVPYDHAPDTPDGWVADQLTKRFFKPPAGITVTLSPAVTGGEARRFEPIMARVGGGFERHEAVPIEHGAVAHFIYDEALANPRHPGESAVGLVYKSEIYDVRRGGEWRLDAPSFGFAFGARQFSVYIELPDNFAVLPDTYRQFLRWSRNLQDHAVVRHFARQVVTARPEWVLALLRRLAPNARHVDAARGEMAGLFARLRIRRRWWPATPDEAAPLPSAPAAPQSAAPPQQDSGPKDDFEYEVAPRIVAVREAADAKERGLDGLAARYYGDSHQLFMNLTYPAVQTLRRTLERDGTVAGAAPGDEEPMRRAAQIAAELAVTRQVCRRLVYALAKRESWTNWQVDQAASPYSLTMAADDDAESFGWARGEMRRQLG